MEQNIMDAPLLLLMEISVREKNQRIKRQTRVRERQSTHKNLGAITIRNNDITDRLLAGRDRNVVINQRLN